MLSEAPGLPRLWLMDDLKARPNGESRLRRLDAALLLRNGIAHGDSAKVRIAQEAGAQPTLASYRRHRSALNGLTVDMAAVVAHHLEKLTGDEPW